MDDVDKRALKALSKLIDEIGYKAFNRIANNSKKPILCLEHLLTTEHPLQEISLPLTTLISDGANRLHANGGLMNPEWLKRPHYYHYILNNYYGIKVLHEGFLIANNHPGLEAVFDETLWAGGLWRHALLNLNGGRKHNPRHFAGSGTGSQRSTFIPIDYTLSRPAWGWDQPLISFPHYDARKK